MSTSGSAVAFLGECVVCGAFEQRRWIHHYGVQNVCISCGIFFGRNYARKFSCNSLHQCKLFQNAPKLTGRKLALAKKACRACRLRKCYRVGMKAENPEQMSSAKKGPVQQNLTKSSSSQLMSLADNKAAVANQTIASLTAFERQMVQFHAQDRVFAPGFLEQFDSLKKLLQFGPNILANFHAVTFPLLPVQNDWFKHILLEPDGILAYNRNRAIHILNMQLVSAVELVRSMPIFHQLDTKDAACLVNFVAIPLYTFNASFYTAQSNSQFWVRASGYSEYQFLIHNFGHDSVINRIADRLYHRSVEKFIQLRMCLEEFLLLRSIITLHSAATGLSNSGRDLVQTEAEKHANILMQYLRCRQGDLDAARRYAELLSVAEATFHNAHRQYEFVNVNYFAVANQIARTALQLVPKMLEPMVYHGHDFGQQNTTKVKQNEKFRVE